MISIAFREHESVGAYSKRMQPAIWNTLEVAKLVVSASTAFILALLGIFIHRTTKRFENRQWLNQKLVEKRIQIYEDLAPLLNDLLCYYTFVGCWKDLDPPDVIRKKRDLDKKLYLAQPLIPKALFDACKKFIDACFTTFNGWGQDAKMKTPTQKRRTSHCKPWEDGWSKYFSDEHVDPSLLQDLYKAAMVEFALSFGRFDFSSSDSLSRLPRNIA
ncbi:hypothetical protein [Granulicella rosea]|uniref:hypothetical protein n=1 Tax=Granulicella rosea TaxID=474952 RepID=UPI00115E2285|nr:hypothetical protein [Granulicella rosea]